MKHIIIGTLAVLGGVGIALFFIRCTANEVTPKQQICHVAYAGSVPYETCTEAK